jgi:ankyrin repeat protein
MCAAYIGHTDVAKELIEKGADVNAKNGAGMTALTFTSSYGHADIAKELIAKGSDMNAKNIHSGYTALLSFPNQILCRINLNVKLRHSKP